jgi:hypothetical protein
MTLPDLSLADRIVGALEKPHTPEEVVDYCFEGFDVTLRQKRPHSFSSIRRDFVSVQYQEYELFKILLDEDDMVDEIVSDDSTLLALYLLATSPKEPEYFDALC